MIVCCVYTCPRNANQSIKQSSHPLSSTSVQTLHLAIPFPNTSQKHRKQKRHKNEKKTMRTSRFTERFDIDEPQTPPPEMLEHPSYYPAPATTNTTKTITTTHSSASMLSPHVRTVSTRQRSTSLLSVASFLSAPSYSTIPSTADAHATPPFLPFLVPGQWRDGMVRHRRDGSNESVTSHASTTSLSTSSGSSSSRSRAGSTSSVMEKLRRLGF